MDAIDGKGRFNLDDLKLDDVVVLPERPRSYSDGDFQHDNPIPRRRSLVMIDPVALENDAVAHPPPPPPLPPVLHQRPQLGKRKKLKKPLKRVMGRGKGMPPQPEDESPLSSESSLESDDEWPGEVPRPPTPPPVRKLEVRDENWLRRQIVAVSEDEGDDGDEGVVHVTFMDSYVPSIEDDGDDGAINEDPQTDEIEVEKVPESEEEKISREALHGQVQALLDIFPDVDPTYLREQIAKVAPMEDCVMRVSAEIVECGDKYPRIKRPVPKKKGKNGTEQDTDYFKFDVEIRDEIYVEYSRAELLNTFRFLSREIINGELNKCNGHFAPALAALQEIGARWKRRQRENPRRWERYPDDHCQRFLDEISFLQQRVKQTALDEDRAFAEKLNEEEYEDAGQSLSCLCCYGDFPFEQMVQCNEGHLFCRDCLSRYVHEAVYGQGIPDLRCMDSSGCEGRFPRSQLEKVLSEKVLKRLDERQFESEIARADLQDLETCPNCCYKVMMPNKEDKIIRCLNPDCMRESCRLCRGESHLPLKCEEAKSASDDTRVLVEKAMSDALLRECHQCHKRFYKLDGCNKMTCSCGAFLCYICRENVPRDIGYGHFCSCGGQDDRDIVVCPTCKKCPLWSNTFSLDRRLIREAAERELKRLNLKPESLPVVMEAIKEAVDGPMPTVQGHNFEYPNIYRQHHRRRPHLRRIPVRVAAAVLDVVGNTIGKIQR